jgi:hypothetical protein
MSGEGRGAHDRDAGEAGEHLTVRLGKQGRELAARVRERGKQGVEPLEVETEPLRPQLGVGGRSKAPPPPLLPLLGVAARKPPRRTRKQRAGCRCAARERDGAGEHGPPRRLQQVECTTVTLRR